MGKKGASFLKKDALEKGSINRTINIGRKSILQSHFQLYASN